VIRPALAVGVLAALAGCSSVEGNSTAASVEGTDVTIDDYQALLQEAVANPEIFGLEEDPATGTLPATTGRQLLSLMVQGAANEEFLAQAGESVTDDDRQAARETLGEDSQLFDLSDDFVSLVVDLEAATSARSRIAAPDAAELERRYTTSPETLGVMCVRHVVVEAEAEADEVLDDIHDGADIETLAVERSIDPIAATNGGAVESGGNVCIPNAEAVAGTDPAFVAAAVTSTPGEPVGPVQTSFGWHVIEARPYEEVSESLTALFDQSAGDLLYGGFMVDADVTVDPRYGRWNGAAASVVPLT
jgi:PPIC-type PPIASE domain